MAAKPRSPEQKERRAQRDRERRAEIAGSRPEPTIEVQAPIPKLHVQRMGKLFRIAYSETRNLAKFNSGEPCDDGGFDNQLDAQIELTKLLGEQGPQLDGEAEAIG